MNIWKFSIYTFLAMFPLTVLYIYIGMKLGEHWNKAGVIMKEYTIPIFGVVFVIIATIIIYRFTKRKSHIL